MTFVSVPEDLELGEWSSLREALWPRRRGRGCPGQGLMLPVFPGQEAFQLIAIDLDGDPLTYSITGQDAFYFDCNATTGNVTLKNTLDREVRSETRPACLSWSSGVMRMEGRVPSPVEELLTASLWVIPWRQSPAPGGKSCLGGGSILPRGGRCQGVRGCQGSAVQTLTKPCLVSPQLRARLSITAQVYDGKNDVVSAGTRAGWLRRVLGMGREEGS